MKKDTYRLYSSLPVSKSSNKHAIIRLSALRSNYRILSNQLKTLPRPPRILAVVKADAYGHGVRECIPALMDVGCDFFAVSCIEEALAVRDACREHRAKADILILGYTPPQMASVLAKEGFVQALLSPSYAEELAAAARGDGVRVRVHIAVDTGMNRIGYAAQSDEDIAAAAEDIVRLSFDSSLQTEGMFTHLSSADEEEAEAVHYTDLQVFRYRALKTALEERGCVIPFHHVCNSAASMLRPDDCFDGVRIGILLYGAMPSLHCSLPLEPVMKLEATISHLHPLHAGEYLGYGRSFCSPVPLTVAVLPLGYADGLLRSYSGAYLSLKTKTAVYQVPIIGRICMDQCMLDVSGTDAAVGDVVTVFGAAPHQLAALSKRAGTIDYEVLCLISSRVDRIYTDNFQTNKENERQ